MPRGTGIVFPAGATLDFESSGAGFRSTGPAPWPWGTPGAGPSRRSLRPAALGIGLLGGYPPRATASLLTSPFWT